MSILPVRLSAPSRGALPRLTMAFALLVSSLLLHAPVAARAIEELPPEVHAADQLLRSAELRPTDQTALELYRQAQAEALVAIQRHPDSAAAHFLYFAASGRILVADGLAKNLFTLRQLDRDYLDKALLLDPHFASALAARGGVLTDLPRLIGGDPVEGLRLLRQAAATNPASVGTRVSLAKALLANGNLDDARTQARIAAHRACIQGRAKTLDAALEVLQRLDSSVARAGLP